MGKSNLGSLETYQGYIYKQVWGYRHNYMGKDFGDQGLILV